MSVISFTNVVGVPVGIASVSFTLIFTLATRIIKNYYHNKKKKKKHDRIFMLAKSKLNSIETLVSQVMIDMKISHEEFVTILKERFKYGKMKENWKKVNENMRLNSVNSKKKTSL